MERRTSAEWYENLRKFYDITILDPDGWDRKNYEYSFNEELITSEEFDRRLMASTVIGGMYPSEPQKSI